MKVLITDDHSVVRQGYAALLSSMLPAPVSIIEAEGGEEACQVHREQHPDVTIMDISLPGISGIEVTRRICEREPASNILIFSMHDEVPVIEQAIEAGAKGYITKNCEPEILIEAVKKVATGQRYIQHDLLMHMTFHKSQGHEKRLGEMTPREFEIFVHLAKGLSIATIAEKLCVSTKTVANYSSQLKSKLGVSNSAELVHMAINNGIIKIGQVDEDKSSSNGNKV